MYLFSCILNCQLLLDVCDLKYFMLHFKYAMMHFNLFIQEHTIDGAGIKCDRHTTVLCSPF